MKKFKRQPNLTAAQIQDIEKRLRGGEPGSKVARSLKRSKGTIYAISKRLRSQETQLAHVIHHEDAEYHAPIVVPRSTEIDVLKCLVADLSVENMALRQRLLGHA